MVLTTRLKIWTLISHALIIVGLGHGIATLGMTEFFWLSTIFESSHSPDGDRYITLAILQLVAFMCLAGQISVFVSMFLSHSSLRKCAHFGGLGLLWASVIGYAYGIRHNNYAHISILSCIPFVYCTIVTFFGGCIGLLWQKVNARIWWNAANMVLP